MSVRVWKMDDCDWVAAETLDEAIKEWESHVGLSAAEESLDPHLMSWKEMDAHTFHDPETGTTRSFSAELRNRVRRGEKFPQFFASTEF